MFVRCWHTLRCWLSAAYRKQSRERDMQTLFPAVWRVARDPLVFIHTVCYHCSRDPAWQEFVLSEDRDWNPGAWLAQHLAGPAGKRYPPVRPRDRVSR